jgi:hypothetical protein
VGDLGTGRGALALFSASHESCFKVPSNYYTVLGHRVLGITTERAYYVRRCPHCNEAHYESRGFGSSSTTSGTSMSGERSTTIMLMDHSPRALGVSFSSTIGLSTCLKRSCLKRRIRRDGTRGWRSAVFGLELLAIDRGMWCGETLGPHIVILLLM